jgi:L-fucose mutarotase/ribose pyranase (RbsD/FucU family)
MIKKIVAVFIIVIGIISCSKPVQQQQNKVAQSEVLDWKLEVENTLKLFGHRNWIVIADGAYPQQSNRGIKTIAIDANPLEAVDFVNQLIEKAKHVDANIFLDREMAFIPEKEAKGIETYRNKLHKVLEGKRVKTRLHEDIIQELDASAKLFNVLIIKTDLAIPYTSVFFQLECGYWNAEAEKSLRTNLLEE